MKPFNLQAALAGAPVITRSGRKGKVKAHLPEARENCCVVAVLDNGGIMLVTEQGRIFPNVTSCDDLFMAPVKRTVWVNFYPAGTTSTAMYYETREKADMAACINRIGGKAYPVEIGE